MNDDFRFQTTLTGQLLPRPELPLAFQLTVAAARGTQICVGASGGNIAISNNTSLAEIASAMVSTEMLPIIEQPGYLRLRPVNTADSKTGKDINVAIEFGCTA